MPQDVFSFATGYISIAVILYYTGHTLCHRMSSLFATGYISIAVILYYIGHTLFHRTYFMLQDILHTAVLNIKYVLYVRFCRSPVT